MSIAIFDDGSVVAAGVDGGGDTFENINYQRFVFENNVRAQRGSDDGRLSIFINSSSMEECI